MPVKWVSYPVNFICRTNSVKIIPWFTYWSRILINIIRR